MSDKRREPSQEERDTDTALHDKEINADRPPSPEVQADLDRLAERLGHKRTDG